MNNEEERYRRVKARVNELKDFYQHLAAYVTVNLFLLLIDVVTGGGWWFQFVAFFWGLGVIVHGIEVFGTNGLFDQNWEERKIREVMEREKRKNDE